ncbi:MAG TPA: hypothetical protein ENF67_01215 [Candidatus Pacearchaeota archaeon]|nr:hypothetical protein [Candidatus Pacearchaeota archaeon]
MLKKVEKYKEGKKVKEEMKECHPLNLKPASKFIEPIWYDCIKEIFSYEKHPALFSQHLLFLDDRIEEGLRLYRENKIKELVKTKNDVMALVESSSQEGKLHRVVIKGWFPEKLIRFRYEIIKYLENLTVSCDCEDFMINGKYRTNCSLVCKHISAVFWWLMQEAEMPKFFITPEEKEKGWYEKSKALEIATHLEGVSMKKYTPWLNVLLLKDFKGIPTSLALSIHREATEERYRKEYKPVWLTFSETETVEKLIRAIVQGYIEMLVSRGKSEEEIKKAVSNLVPFVPKERKGFFKLLMEKIFRRK